MIDERTVKTIYPYCGVGCGLRAEMILQPTLTNPLFHKRSIVLGDCAGRGAQGGGRRRGICRRRRRI